MIKIPLYLELRRRESAVADRYWIKQMNFHINLVMQGESHEAIKKQYYQEVVPAFEKSKEKGLAFNDEIKWMKELNEI